MPRKNPERIPAQSPGLRLVAPEPGEGGGTSYPGSGVAWGFNPERVAPTLRLSRKQDSAATLSGLAFLDTFTEGSSFLATLGWAGLGWRTQSPGLEDSIPLGLRNRGRCRADRPQPRPGAYRSLIPRTFSTNSTNPSVWDRSRFSKSGSFSRPPSSSKSLICGRKTLSGKMYALR